MQLHLNKRLYYRLASRFACASLIFLFFFMSAVIHTRAQGSFSSGSTGADGAFNPTTSQTIQVPASGVFNFTTVNISSGVVIRFVPNANNTPVVILATGNVTLSGVIDITGNSASGANAGAGGPGGRRGGSGGLPSADSSQGQAGDGPGGGLGGSSGPDSRGGGGGYATNGINGEGSFGGQGGQAYGDPSLLPLLGGSGGGGSGSNGSGNLSGNGGGGGGGAILIASSGSIISTGTILARGGSGGATLNGRSGGGSGGAIRLISNTITGDISLDVAGGISIGASGAPGFIRIEAFDYTGFRAFPNASAALTTGIPGPITPPSTASRLRIASIGGVSAPSSPVGSLQGQPDVILPASLANPVTVALEASSLPLGARIDVTVTPERGAPVTVQSTPLSGTEANSTATASINLSNMLSVISAKFVVNLNPLKPNSTSLNMPTMINGERISQIEVSAVYGGASQVTYITQSGRRVGAQP